MPYRLSFVGQALRPFTLVVRRSVAHLISCSPDLPHYPPVVQPLTLTLLKPGSFLLLFVHLREACRGNGIWIAFHQHTPELFTVSQFILADALEPRAYLGVVAFRSMDRLQYANAAPSCFFFVSAETLPTVTLRY